MNEADLQVQRAAMVEDQLRARGIDSPLVLDAMGQVRREAFVPEQLRSSAYHDSPLPIAAGQTISQPFIVAMMLEALDLTGGERVLDVGTGSGYAAAVIACIAERVYSIERIEELAEVAKQALSAEGFNNVELRLGDGTLGWPEAAPFDAINVAAGAPVVPEALKQQLAIGGRLVLPVGAQQGGQQLLRITRVSADEYVSEELAAVRFVPLIGEEGWAAQPQHIKRGAGYSKLSSAEQALVERIAEAAEPFSSVDSLPLEGLLQRIGDSRLVLMGEASHGSAEFYQARQRITQALIEEQGFDFVVVEADWPDAARINHYVQHTEVPPSEWTAFARFPTWMWRNEDVRDFVDWLRAHNGQRQLSERVAFYGLDLYSPYQSIDAVLSYLEQVDPATAAFARQRYACLAPYKPEAANYGRWAGSPEHSSCESAVREVLHAVQAGQETYIKQGRDAYLDAVQNAQLVVSAEAYYRLMYDESYNTWNLRDSYMFETIQALLAHHGENSRGIVWAHNSHIGDARATDRRLRDELNIGQLCREHFATDAYLIGFGTNTGTVAAANNWAEPMEVKQLNPVLAESYEYLCHATGHAGFLLPLARGSDPQVRAGLMKPRLGRAIGVIYRPHTERASHYYEAILPQQFDEYIWIEDSQAVTPLDTQALAGMPDTYPFAT